jgi:S1-C subfamily serine protease
VLFVLIAAVAVGEALGSAIGRRIGSSLGTGFLGAADRVFGAFVGAAQALLIIWLAGGLAAVGPVPRLSEAAQTSTAIRSLNALLPPATEVAAGLGDAIGTSGLPDVFLGFEPLPLPPVDRPPDRVARAIGAAAEGATLRVEAAACGYESSGTGALYARDYVVTNAHVVAGANPERIQVVTIDGRRRDATVVLFDPDLDVAVLRARGVGATPLRFAARDPKRGATGASLGYPGGRNLTIVPAAVTGAYPAKGRDIYDRSTVTRDILELRAVIDRGDSGGPFVLSDGTIGGLVFAEARTDPEVGYALAPTQVATRVRPAIGRTDPVETGDCVH